jgi:hypothetical protein
LLRFFNAPDPHLARDNAGYHVVVSNDVEHCAVKKCGKICEERLACVGYGRLWSRVRKIEWQSAISTSRTGFY